MTLQGFLQVKDPDYDPVLCLLGETLSSPGYHTTLANGTWVHPTRESLEYAIALLRDGSSERKVRARDIIKKVISLQDCDPVSPTYGIWSWFADEPLSQMNPPDWNWADFLGLLLAEIIKEHADKVLDLLGDMRTALYHAGGSIYRRNIHAGYTNISVMGALVTALAGEILEDQRIAEYGLRRLRRCVEHFEHHGGFAEYNSPVYTTVVLRDCEKGVRLLSDPVCRETAGVVLHAAWQTIADHFHPATRQWAGPHSRSYSTFLATPLAELLQAQTGVSIPPHPLEQTGHSAKVTLDDLPGPGCPAALRERFVRLPQPVPYEIRRRFQRREPEENSTWGTTWFAPEACLGSVNADAHWDQRRALLGYWVGATGVAVALRLSFLRDGKQFASVFVRNTQVGPRVLTAVTLLLKRGVFHPIWGAPKNNVFDAEDLRLRYELKGAGVEATQAGDNQFELRAGNWAARLSTASAFLGESAVPWQIERGEDFVSVDAVLHQGARREFPFAKLRPVILAAGLHLVDLRDGDAPFAPIETEHCAERETVRSRYAGLELMTADHATPVPFD